MSDPDHLDDSRAGSVSFLTAANQTVTKNRLNFGSSQEVAQKRWVTREELCMKRSNCFFFELLGSRSENWYESVMLKTSGN